MPAIGRASLFWAWCFVMIFTVSCLAYKAKTGLELWAVDFFQAMICFGISVPAFVEYISEEPTVIRNAILGKRTFWKNSQVVLYFELNEFDCAVLALINDPIWIISDEKASFTQRGGHPRMVRDISMTDANSLRKLCVFDGR